MVLAEGAKEAAALLQENAELRAAGGTLGAGHAYTTLLLPPMASAVVSAREVAISMVQPGTHALQVVPERL